MKVVGEYSHLGGSEILKLRHPQADCEIYEVIGLVKAQWTETRGEMTVRGGKQLSRQLMRERFSEHFHRRGYQDLQNRFSVFVPDSETAVLDCFDHLDFVKGRVFVVVRFGNQAFMLYDMTRFQYFFDENEADVGVEIVPCHPLHKQMPTGVSDDEHVGYDFERLKGHFPVVPVKVVLIDEDDPE